MFCFAVTPIRFFIAIIVVLAAGLAAPLVICQNAAVTVPATAPELRVFDSSLIDKGVDPCENFYRYSCNGWFKRNPLPADQASYGRFTELYELNRAHLREILEAAAVPSASRSANEQKIGDEYASCMDEAAVNKLGLEPLDAGAGPHRRDAIRLGVARAAGASALDRRECILRHGSEPGLCRFERNDFVSIPRADWVCRSVTTTRAPMRNRWSSASSTWPM